MKKLILILVCLSSSLSFAQDSTSKTSAKLSTVLPEKKTGPSLSLDLSRSSNLFEKETADAKMTTDLEVAIGYAFSNGMKAGLVGSISRNEIDFNGVEETVAGDTVASFSLAPIQLNRDNTATYSARGIIPTSVASRRDATLMGAASARAALTTKKQLLGRPLAINSFIDALQFFHEYDTSLEFEGTMAYRGRVFLGAELELTKKISLGLDTYYQAGKTNQDALKTKFLLAEKLSYKLSDGASIYVAHSNDGNALGPNGEDSTVKAFGATTSKLGAGLSATF